MIAKEEAEKEKAADRNKAMIAKEEAEKEKAAKEETEKEKAAQRIAADAAANAAASTVNAVNAAISGKAVGTLDASVFVYPILALVAVLVITAGLWRLRRYKKLSRAWKKYWYSNAVVRQGIPAGQTDSASA